MVEIFLMAADVILYTLTLLMYDAMCGMNKSKIEYIYDRDIGIYI